MSPQPQHVFLDTDGKTYLPQQSQPTGPTQEQTQHHYLDSDGNPFLLPTSAPQLSGQPAGALPNQQQTEDSFSALTQQTEDALGNRVAPFLGRLTANSLPMVGSFFGPEGTAAGIVGNQLLRHLAPHLFGEPPEGILGHLGSAAEDVFSNEVLPRGISAALKQVSNPGSFLLRNFPSVREAVVKRISDEAMGRFAGDASGTIEQGAQDTANTFGHLKDEISLQAKLHPPTTGPNGGLVFHPDMQAAMGAMSDTFKKNEIGQNLLKMSKEMAAGVDVAASQTYQKIANTALSDLTHLRNVKLATGSGDFAEQLALNKLLTQNFSETTGKLNAKGIIDSLSSKGLQGDVLREAISPATQASLSKLTSEIQSQTEGHGISDAVVSYANHRLLWSTAALGGLHEGLAIPGIAGAGITLTNSMLAKAMANPATADLVVQAMRTPTSAPAAGLINKALSRVFQGVAVVGTTPEK